MARAADRRWPINRLEKTRQERFPDLQAEREQRDREERHKEKMSPGALAPSPCCLLSPVLAALWQLPAWRLEILLGNDGVGVAPDGDLHFPLSLSINARKLSDPFPSHWRRPFPRPQSCECIVRRKFSGKAITER